jgi:hypothetical protein
MTLSLIQTEREQKELAFILVSDTIRFMETNNGKTVISFGEKDLEVESRPSPKTKAAQLP